MLRFIFGGLLIVAGLGIFFTLVPLACVGGMFSGEVPWIGAVFVLIGFVLMFAGGYLMRTSRRR